MNIADTASTAAQSAEHQPRFGVPKTSWFSFFRGAFGHSFILILRRRRLILVTFVAFLPVLIPLALAYLSKSPFAEDGAFIFARVAERGHINLIAPLLAFFFAAMLVAEDVESQTMVYFLTRPIPRSAWLLGRFFSFTLVAALILLVSIFMTFAGCTALSDLHFTPPHLMRMARYMGIAVFGLLAYSGIATFISAATRRPIVIGALLFFGWQKLILMVPGLADFLTVQKYTDCMLPRRLGSLNLMEVETILGVFNKEMYLLTPVQGALALLIITGLGLLLALWALREKEYAADRAAGA